LGFIIDGFDSYNTKIPTYASLQGEVVPELPVLHDPELPELPVIEELPEDEAHGSVARS
jgi:hypothetical protein